MARGRKRDLTIPPSRALSQQRAYRDRKAQYVAELEQRARRAEVHAQLASAAVALKDAALGDAVALCMSSSSCARAVLPPRPTGACTRRAGIRTRLKLTCIRLRT